jgi:hypothetical protein
MEVRIRASFLVLGHWVVGEIRRCLGTWDVTTQTHMSGIYEEIDFERRKGSGGGRGRGCPTESEQHIIRTNTE